MDEKKMKGIIGKKIGMTRLFDETGKIISGTLIEAGPCTVVQVKTMERDGYNAVQVGFKNRKEKKTSKPMAGHFKKNGVAAFQILKEFRDFEGELKQGDQIRVDIFSEGERIKLTGHSKGKGFAGVVKRHGFKGGPKTHGQSDRLRAPGSIGQSAYPNRVYRGLRMGGRMGNQRTTIRNLRVLKIFLERNMLLIEGGVPGSRNSIVEICK